MAGTLAFLQNLGTLEIVVICVVALLLFGNRLPSVARNVGKTYADFKRGIDQATSEVKREMDKAAEEIERPVESPAPPPPEKAPSHQIDATSGPKLD